MSIYEYPTNFTNGTTIDGIGNMFIYANNVTSGGFAYGIIFLVFFITLTIGAMSGFKRAGASAAFVSAVFSFLFLRLGMVNPILPIILIIFSVIFALAGGKEGGRI